MNTEPLVSVCIPSYNHARFLPAAIESVLSQTYPHFEVIIADDGSPDGSLEIARRYAAGHPQIKVYTHPDNANHGISRTGNLAIEKMTGKYWTACCSDDIWYPHKLERQVALMENNPDVGLVYSFTDLIDDDGVKLPASWGRDITAEPDPLAILLEENPITGTTMMARHETLIDVGLHDENLIYSDWEMWIRFAAATKIAFIPESLTKYRIHSYNTSVGIHPTTNFNYVRQMYLKLQTEPTDKSGKLKAEKYQKIIAEQLAYLPVKESYAHLVNYYDAVASRNFSAAAASLKEAVKASPPTVFGLKRIASILKHLAMSLTGLGKNSLENGAN